jgi:hypothetical protein
MRRKSNNMKQKLTTATKEIIGIETSLCQEANLWLELFEKMIKNHYCWIVKKITYDKVSIKETSKSLYHLWDITYTNLNPYTFLDAINNYLSYNDIKDDYKSICETIYYEGAWL